MSLKTGDFAGLSRIRPFAFRVVPTKSSSHEMSLPESLFDGLTACDQTSLVLSPMSISESGGISTVTATLSGALTEAVTVTVSAAPLSGAVVADYALSTNKALVIAAGSTASTGTVTAVSSFYTVGSDATIVIAAGSTANASDTATIAAVDNTTDAPDRAGTVTATVSNDVGTGTRSCV